MAKILDVDGDDLNGSDRGMMFMLVVCCDDLTYLEKKYVRDLLMPQYADVVASYSIEGHPLSIRMEELKDKIKRGSASRVREAKRNMIKPKKRGE